MHDEEFHQRIVVVDDIQHEMKIQMKRVMTANARLQEQLSDQRNLLNKFEISTEQLDIQVQTQQEKKIDAKLFENKMVHMKNIVQNLEKRMNHGENEMREFGEYMIRYMPLLLQNLITDNLIGSINNSLGLRNLQQILKTKDEEFRNIKEPHVKLYANLLD